MEIDSLFHDRDSAAAGCDMVVLATPSFAIRTTARKLKDIVTPGTVLVSDSLAGQVSYPLATFAARYYALGAQAVVLR